MRTCVLLSLTLLAVGCASSSGDLGAGGWAGYGGTTGEATGGTSTGGRTSNTGGKATGGTSTGGKAGTGGTSGTGGVVNPGDKSARGVASKLGRKTNFLIGIGNDGNQFDTTFASFGVTMDIHYLYLTPGWSRWTGTGGYVAGMIDTATSKGTTAMATYYGFDDGAVGELQNQTWVKGFWDETAILFQVIKSKNVPVIVHFMPDFWMYIQNAAGGSTSYPAPVKINSACTDLPDTIGGFGNCIVRMARQTAPKAIIGFHASAWNGWSSGGTVANFLKGCGGNNTDIVFVETLDRDAGCLEARWSSDVRCAKGCTGCYWSDSEYSQHLTWVKNLTTNLGIPALWWQTPFGVPSSTPGGSPGHWRDNRVQHFFSHVPDLVAANGLGATFGAGAGNQTSFASDNGQFKNAVQTYFKSPTPL